MMLRDGSIFRPSAVTIPDEIQERIENLQNAAWRRQRDIDEARRDRGTSGFLPDPDEASDQTPS